MAERWGPARPVPSSMIPSSDPRVVQKRSSDEMDSADEVEPAFKRPALAERLHAAVAQQDIAMSEAAAGVESSGKCPHICSRPWHVLEEGCLGSWPFVPADFRQDSMQGFIEESDPLDTGGAYWYRKTRPIQQGVRPSCSLHEMSIQDMKLLPGRTFFYIDEMINSIKGGVNWVNGESLVFELFAAVARSGCGDNDGRFQYFQLEDLFGGPPFITGMMEFTEEDYHMYSSRFLRATKADDKCYCRCKVVKDEQSEHGWSLYIYDIQPVSWETMQSAHANMGKMTDDGVVERQTKMCVGEEFW
ncbi:hypothetical protein J3F83DRAFT_729185 [Trichoderma novae-zelandiae]